MNTHSWQSTGNTASRYEKERHQGNENWKSLKTKKTYSESVRQLAAKNYYV